MPNGVGHEIDQQRSSTHAKGRIRLVRTIVALGLFVVLLLALVGYLWLGGPSDDGQTESGQPSIGGPFTLADAAGNTVTDRTFRGKYMLIYFGYTFCPDVCPTTLNALSGALEKLGPSADHVQPLFITVDPKRDTPSVSTPRRSPHALSVSPEQASRLLPPRRSTASMPQSSAPGPGRTTTP
jgi:hypothetical protein